MLAAYKERQLDRFLNLYRELSNNTARLTDEQQLVLADAATWAATAEYQDRYGMFGHC